MATQAIGAGAGALLCAGPQAVGCAIVGGLIGAGVLIGGWILTRDDIENADQAADEDLATTDTEACASCPCERTVMISQSATPHVAQHVVDAQAAGHPSVLTLDRAGATARRSASLAGIPTKPGLDRDEYPPAVFLEGGAGASVRHIPFSDNRRAGAMMRNQLRGATEGCKITMSVGP